MPLSIKYASSHVPFIQAASEFIRGQSADSWIVLPRRHTISWMRRALAQHSPAQIPKLMSLDMPWGYPHSCFMSHKPASRTQSLAWMVQFLESNGYTERSLSHMLTLAWSLLDLWEKCQNVDGIHQELEKIPLHCLSEHSQKTIEILKSLINIWPYFLSKRGHVNSIIPNKEAANIIISQPHVSSIAFVGIHPYEDLSPDNIKALELRQGITFFLPAPSSWSHESNFSKFGREQLADRSSSEEISMKVPKKSLKCRTIMEQARAIAFLIDKMLQHPTDTVALVGVPSSLSEVLSYEMNRWGIPLTLSDEPLWVHFLWIFLQGAYQQWSRDNLLTLARHPLTVKRWPIALSMASKAETMDLVSPSLPLWALKALSLVESASKTILHMKEGKHSWERWLEAHISGALAFLGEDFKESFLTILEEWGKIPSHPLSLSQYYEFFSFLKSKWGHKLSLLKNHPRVFLCTVEDLSFLCSEHIIVAGDQEPILPWLPPSISGLLNTPCGKWPSHSWHISLSEEADTDSAAILRQWGESLEALQKEGELPYSQNSPLKEEVGPWPESNSAVGCVIEERGRHSETVYSSSLLRDPQLLLGSASFLPPLSSVSVSDIQLWRTNFTNFYKRKILRIGSKDLSEAQIWGMCMHVLMEKFITMCPPNEKNSLKELTEVLTEIASVVMPPMDFIKHHMLRSLCKSIAHCEWTHREKGVIRSVTECNGRITFHFSRESDPVCLGEGHPDGGIHLTARADRLDLMNDGTIHVIDYKAGVPPTFTAVDLFEAVQLPLEALIAEEGSYQEDSLGSSLLSSPHVTEPIHWRKTGPGFPLAGKVSGISWWHLSLSKGCSIRQYPRPLDDLLAKYKAHLPCWMHMLANGTYYRLWES